MASPAPTRAARTTRGRRSSSRTASWVPLSPPERWTPRGPSRRSSSVTTTAPGGKGSAPTHTPASRVRRSAAPAPASTSPGRRRPRGVVAGGCPEPGRVPLPAVAVIGVGSVLQGVGHGLGEVRDARAPAGGDVVVGLEDAVLLDGRHGVERRPLRHGLGGLLAALRVGQDDQAGRLADDVLGGELRVATGRRAGLV